MKVDTLDKLRQKLREIKKEYPREKTALLPALHLIQEIFGYLTEEGLRLIEEELGISSAYARSVASFYQFFRFKPLGRIHIQVCTNLTCMIKGAKKLVEFLRETYRIEELTPTDDGFLSYEEVECIGLCDGAPAVLINGDRYTSVVPEKLKETIEKLRMELSRKPSPRPSPGGRGRRSEFY
jgi:NADH:ubiquinone oxidoreductase subunit E